MAGTDTVVGIVGAALLLAVMVGVFVYEYNNAPASASPDAQKLADFGSKHPAMDPMGDVDQDGILNYNETDLSAHVKLDGSLSQTTNGPLTKDIALHVERGITSVTATIHFTSNTPNPLPPNPNFQVALLDSSGTTVVAGTTTFGGAGSSAGTATFTVDGAELEPGTYQVRITESSPSAGGSWTGMADLAYA